MIFADVWLITRQRVVAKSKAYQVLTGSVGVPQDALYSFDGDLVIGNEPEAPTSSLTLAITLTTAILCCTAQYLTHLIRIYSPQHLPQRAHNELPRIIPIIALPHPTYDYVSTVIITPSQHRHWELLRFHLSLVLPTHPVSA